MVDVYLDKPVTKKQYDSGKGPGVRFASCSMQGWRVSNGDASTALTALGSPFDSWSFFGVFDGHSAEQHGGDRVSQYSSDHLLDCITKTKDFAHLKHGKSSTTDTERLIRGGLIEGFLRLDEKIRKHKTHCTVDHAGSTAICALITPQTIYLANCGDSQGMIVSRNRIALTTSEHKPTKPAEYDRITSAGEVVDNERVGGTLAMSRALGDFEFKNVHGLGPLEQPVIAKPDVFEWKRCSEDEFVVLACDGVWDVMSREEVKEFVRGQLETEDLEGICRRLVDHCLKKGSQDNISVILIVFTRPPSLSEREQSDHHGTVWH